MKKLILPILMLIFGAGAGIAGGLFLFPAHHDEADLAACLPDEEMATEIAHGEDALPAELADREYARMNNQFVVPVVEEGKVAALVVLSVSIEVVAGQKEPVYQAEPRLRDSFLQVLFDHANLGGFEGAFTNSNNMRHLRGALKTAAQDALGDRVTDVLIIDIVRQDV